MGIPASSVFSLAIAKVGRVGPKVAQSVCYSASVIYS